VIVCLFVGPGVGAMPNQCGNPDGVPALFLHGGPGLGSGLAARCFFNPRLFRIIVFDQRGSGRSRPLGCIERNTTGHLLADIERVRVHLGVEAWGVVVGGSWGSLLAVAYAQLQPLRVQALVLRGTFLGSAAEIRWLYVHMMLTVCKHRSLCSRVCFFFSSFTPVAV